MKCDDYDTIRNTIQGIPMSTLSRKRPKDVDPELKKRVTDLRTQVKKMISDIKERYFAFDSAFIRKQSASCDRVLRELSKVALGCHDAYDNAKRDRNH